eukprot:6180482-Pleurochrysis_carterae.AAC.4
METGCRCGMSRKYHRSAGALMPGGTAGPRTAACHSPPPRSPRSSATNGSGRDAKSKTRPRHHGSRARPLHAFASGLGISSPRTWDAFHLATLASWAVMAAGSEYVASAVGGMATPGGHAGSQGGMCTGGVLGICTREYENGSEFARFSGGSYASLRSASGACASMP